MNKKKKFMYGITANVILLSLTSLLTDISSEIITPLIPLYITALGAGGLIVGVVGGLSDSIAAIFHMFSGYLSDRMGKRKKIIITGYSISSFAKLFMAFATSWIHILILRPIERIGKGVRESPRDAVLAETTPKEVHGKVFGINRTFDRTGAIIGSLLAILFITLGFAYNKIFFIAALISFISIIPLLFIKEKKIKPKKESLKVGLKNMPNNLRIFLIISTIFALANFSYMFFILKTQSFFPVVTVIALYLVSNLLFDIFATPAGIAADNSSKIRIILYGYILFFLTCMIFIFFNTLPMLIFGFVIYGVSQAAVMGNSKALTADLSHPKNLGTSIGTFYMFTSIAALPASIIAGALWQYASPNAAFIYGAALSLIAAISLASIKIKEKYESEEELED